MFVENLCSPAVLYLGFALTQILIDFFRKMYNVALIKSAVAVVFTTVLNLLCRRGLTTISWFIVFIPFVTMTFVTAVLLYVFGLGPFTGKMNYAATAPSKPANPNKMARDPQPQPAASTTTTSATAPAQTPPSSSTDTKASASAKSTDSEKQATSSNAAAATTSNGSSTPATTNATTTGEAAVRGATTRVGRLVGGVGQGLGDVVGGLGAGLSDIASGIAGAFQ